jgi:uncharacterized protein YndB with AHSA1/START domain
MPHAESSVTIARPIDNVFGYLLDGERCPEWRPGVVGIRRVSGNGGVGTTYEQTVRGPMGRSIRADYAITVHEPPSRIEFQTLTGPVRPHGTYVLAAAGGGTHVTFVLDAELGGLRRLLLGSAVQKTMEAEVATLENLRARLES